jgi:hypothetical protein
MRAGIVANEYPWCRPPSTGFASAEKLRQALLRYFELQRGRQARVN